jgi:hypothetical protein
MRGIQRATCRHHNLVVEREHFAVQLPEGLGLQFVPPDVVPVVFSETVRGPARGLRRPDRRREIV